MVKNVDDYVKRFQKYIPDKFEGDRAELLMESSYVKEDYIADQKLKIKQELSAYGITSGQEQGVPEYSNSKAKFVWESLKVRDVINSNQDVIEYMMNNKYWRSVAAHSIAATGLRDGYRHPLDIIKQVGSNLWHQNGFKEDKRIKADKIYDQARYDEKYLIDYENTVRLMDYYNFYNGIPQEFNTLDVSAWRPQNIAPDNDKADFYKDNNISSTLKENLSTVLLKCKETMENQPLDANKNEEKVVKGLATDIIAEALYSQKYNGATGWDLYTKLNEHELNTVGDQLGHYSLSIGRDERGCYLSYYDNWNLSFDEACTGQRVSEDKNLEWGTPMEIYDRIYFDPKTLQPIDVRSPLDIAEERHEKILAALIEYDKKYRNDINYAMEKESTTLAVDTPDRMKLDMARYQQFIDTRTDYLEANLSELKQENLTTNERTEEHAAASTPDARTFKQYSGR